MVMSSSSSSSSSLHNPVRSISLPTRLVHSSSLIIEAELDKLQDLESSSAETFQRGVRRLADLLNGVNKEVICSSHDQQVLRHDQHVKLVEDALDASIILLDASDFTRDLVTLLKDQIQDLQSALRRKGGDCLSIENNIRSYISFRKKSRTDISKRLKSLTRAEKHIVNKSQFHKHSVVDHNLSMVSNTLKQSSVLAISVFQSLLLFLSSPAVKVKGNNGWSLIAKLILSGTKLRDQKTYGEVGCVDTSLISCLYGRIRRNNGRINVQEAVRRLNTLNDGLEAIQDELDGLSRRLIQHRVSLLNLLTP